MRNNFKFRFIGILIVLAMIAVFGVAVMLLWNALLPQIFALPQIGYPQAVGLFILARLLLGGIGGGLPGHGGHRGAMADGHPFHHGNKLREKWMNMSEEERKEFMEKEKDFFKFHRDVLRSNDFFGGRENKKDEGNE